jgi:hypothetical protein
MSQTTNKQTRREAMSEKKIYRVVLQHKETGRQFVAVVRSGDETGAEIVACTTYGASVCRSLAVHEFSPDANFFGFYDCYGD